jgi:hypothetical protein
MAATATATATATAADTRRPWFQALRPPFAEAPRYVSLILSGSSDAALLFSDLLQEYNGKDGKVTPETSKALHAQLADLQDAARAASRAVEVLHRMARPGMESECPSTDTKDASVSAETRRGQACMMALTVKHMKRWTDFAPDDTRVALLVVAQAWLEAWPEWPKDAESAPPLQVQHLEKTVERMVAAYNTRYPRVDGISPDWHIAVRWNIPMVRSTIDVILGSQVAAALPERDAARPGPALGLDVGSGGVARKQVHGHKQPDGRITFNDENRMLPTKVTPLPPSPGSYVGSKVVAEEITTAPASVTFGISRVVEGEVHPFSLGNTCTIATNISIGEPHYMAVHVDVECPLNTTVGREGENSPALQLSLYMGSDKHTSLRSGPMNIDIACEEDGERGVLHCGRLWPLGVSVEVVTLEQAFEHNTGVLTLHTMRSGVVTDNTKGQTHPRLLAQIVWAGAERGRSVAATITASEVGEDLTRRRVSKNQSRVTHAEL